MKNQVSNMKEFFTESLAQTVVIFVMMGLLSVMAHTANSKQKLNFIQKFNLFYVNTVAGWGFFSLLISKWPWFGEMPQKVFTIMTVVYVGLNTLNWIKRKNLLGKFLESLKG